MPNLSFLHAFRASTHTGRRALSAAAIGLCAALSAQAGTLAMPDSAGNRLVLFDDQTGAVVNANFFALGGGTPFHAVEVGSEIWVSEQLGDRVSRWSMSGTFLGAIGGSTTGGLDNVRGMALVGSTVYVSNAGTANGAPGAAVLSFDLAGNALGSFTTAATSPSPFGLLSYRSGLLVSSSTAGDDLHGYTLSGASLGTFYDGSGLNFGEQLAYAGNGDILVAGFSSNNIVRFDAGSGAILASYTAPSARGVWQLGNGNILWTNGGGAYVLDPASNTSTQIYTGSGRFLQAVGVVPEPAAVAMWALGLATVAALRFGPSMRARRHRARADAAA